MIGIYHSLWLVGAIIVLKLRKIESFVKPLNAVNACGNSIQACVGINLSPTVQLHHEVELLVSGNRGMGTE